MDMDMPIYDNIALQTAMGLRFVKYTCKTRLLGNVTSGANNVS